MSFPFYSPFLLLLFLIKSTHKQHFTDFEIKYFKYSTRICSQIFSCICMNGKQSFEYCLVFIGPCNCNPKENNNSNSGNETEFFAQRILFQLNAFCCCSCTFDGKENDWKNPLYFKIKPVELYAYLLFLAFFFRFK